MLISPHRAEVVKYGIAWKLFITQTMGVSVKFSRLRHAISMAALLSMPVLASAACCPNDGNGVQMAKSGLGQSQPAAMNLSLDPAWALYGFEREGVSYYQVNDLAGEVRLIVARIDDTFWTLPAGKHPARTSLPTRPLALPTGAARRVVFRQPDFALVVYGQGGDAVWSVERPPATP